MYCKYCGKEIDDDAKFCKYCGKSQNGSSGGEDELSKNPYISQANSRASAQVDARLKQHFNLRPDTRVVMETTYHTIIMIPFYICLIFEIFYSLISFGTVNSRRFYHLAMAISVIVFILIILTALIYLRLPLSEFGITEDRLLIRVWLGKKLNIPLSRIKEVTADKGIFNRIDCGTLRVKADGQTYTFRCVACAETFKDALVKQINRAA